MDQVRIGKAIKLLRLKLGYTQRDLANHLNVTDKAVSKWERGLGVPDISLITEIADFLNIDVDNLLNGNITFLDREWKGVFLADRFCSDFKFDSMLYDKPLVYLYISYFLLVGIREVLICCKDQMRVAFEAALGDGASLGIHLIYQNETELNWKSNMMVLQDSVFIYGSNLTKYFQRAMSRQDTVTELAIPKPTGSIRFNRKMTDKNMSSDVRRQELFYEMLPVWFLPYGIAAKVESSESLCAIRQKASSKVLCMGKGIVFRRLRNYADLLETASFIRFLQDNTGYRIYLPEEIAWRRGMITDEQALDFARDEPERRQYLDKLISNKQK